MKLSELIEFLQDYQTQNEGEDPEVQFQYQPNWPLLSGISQVIDAKEIHDREIQTSKERENRNPTDESDDEHYEFEGPNVIYLVEGRHIGYGSRYAWG